MQLWTLNYSQGVQFSLHSQYPYLPYKKKSPQNFKFPKKAFQGVSLSLDSHAISIAFALKQISKFQTPPRCLSRRVPLSLNSNAISISSSPKQILKFSNSSKTSSKESPTFLKLQCHLHIFLMKTNPQNFKLPKNVFQGEFRFPYPIVSFLAKASNLLN